MDRFNPPAFGTDFTRRPAAADAFAAGWDAILASWFEVFDGLEGGGFYNPRTDTTPGETERQSVAWDAFPRPLQKWFEDDAEPDLMRWRAAESLRPRLFGGQPLRRVVDGSLAEPVTVLYRQQDEYCEWFVRRDEAGRPERVTFTCEVPEYWQFLAMGTAAFFPADDERARIVEGDLGLVTELYREFVDPSIESDDLLWPFDVAAFDAEDSRWYYFGRQGSYNPFNKWTTTEGVMHLTHPANTIVGELRVAARAAVLRQDADGRPVDDAEAIVCCSGFGEPDRSSDPSIGSAVNGLVKAGFSVSLADPVGLYIAGIDLSAFEGPGGQDVTGAWRVERGSAERQMILRATLASPPGAPFSTGEMRAGGAPIAFGGQIADEVQMILTGLAKRRGTESAVRQPCVTTCCEHPEKPGVEAVVVLGEDCAEVDWAARAPATGDQPLPPGSAGLLAEAPDTVVGIADGPDPDAAVRARSR